jgi:flagellar assembly protein FliH
MLSKVLPPEQAVDTSPVPWKLVHREQEGHPAPEKEPPPDIAGITAQLDRQWEQRVREAHAAGVREGEAAGRSQAAAEVQPVIERLTRSIEELAQLRGRLRREAEEDMLRLSLAIARRVLRRELTIDPEAMHGLVLAALEKLQVQEISRVRVHPSQAPQIGASLEKAHQGLRVKVVPDSTREPGALIFETERGNLDASADTQLREIERGLADRLRGHG